MMTVREVIKKYNLEGFTRQYHNQYGNFCNVDYKDLDNFFNLPVKSIDIHLPTESVVITVIEEVK